MPKTAEEVLIGLASTSFKLDEQGVAALKEADGSFKDDAIDHLIKLDAERVATLRGDSEKRAADSYSRGKRETMEELEKSLKEEYGVKANDVKGKDLIKAIIAEKAGTANTLSDDKVKTHQLYRQLEEHAANLEKATEAKVKETEERIRAEFNSVRDTESVLGKAIAIFKEMKPILPKNEEVARNQMSLLEQFVKGHKFQVTKDKDGNVTDIVPMKEDGTGRLEDSHGHAVKFDDLIKGGARKFYEFDDAQRKTGAPNPNSTGGTDKTGDDGDVYAPKNMAEYAQLHAQIMQSYTGAERREQLNLLKEAAVQAGVVKA